MKDACKERFFAAQSRMGRNKKPVRGIPSICLDLLIYAIICVKISPKGQEYDNMDDIAWNSLVIEINEYLEADDSLEEGLRQVVQLNLQIGTNSPSERNAAHGALKALLKGRDGTPFRRGQKSAVPASVRVAIDRICGVVEEASLAYFNHDAIIGAVTLKHTKSGGGAFESAEAYADSVVRRTRNNLAKMFKNGDWDGSVESLLPSETEDVIEAHY